MTRPRALDLFACEGGVTRGLQHAGFHVTAVDNDINRLKRNPAEVLVKADAIEFALDYGHLFDFIWASPPCQDYTAGTRAVRSQGGVTGYPRLIEATRDALKASGKPWAIENVAGARDELRDPVVMCGGDFGLKAIDDDSTLLHLQRHRLVETTLPLGGGACEPFLCRYDRPGRQVAGVYGGARSDKHEARNVRHGGYVPKGTRIREELLGLTGSGMSLKGLEECVPPAYAFAIGSAAAQQLGADVLRGGSSAARTHDISASPGRSKGSPLHTGDPAGSGSFEHSHPATSSGIAASSQQNYTGRGARDSHTSASCTGGRGSCLPGSAPSQAHRSTDAR